MMKHITVKAGEKAYRAIRDGAFSPDKIKILAGASGGPKWIALYGFDRVLMDLFKNRTAPLFCVGSSIGSWRFAALASGSPAEMADTFLEHYINQRYTGSPPPKVITGESIKILDSFLNIENVLAHPFMRLNILSVRARGFGASEKKALKLTHLAGAALCNLAFRPSLNMFFQRTIFHDGAESDIPFDEGPFTAQRVPLSGENLPNAVLASGAIPLVMESIRDIPGAGKGTYLDGGIIDYHLDLPYRCGSDEFVLYPHFFDRIMPGWFDKSLPWRKPSKKNTAHTVLVCPSREFIDSLPMKKVPDRNDFKTFMDRNDERIACWRETARRTIPLGEQFMEAVHSGGIKQIVEKL